MNHTIHPCWYIIIGLLCSNFSQQESTENKEKPKVNFYGTIIDANGQTIEVEHITIGGLYKEIPVYEKPITTETAPSGASFEPEQETTLLDLKEIDQIQTARKPDPANVAKQRAATLSLNNRTYVEIIVVSRDSKKTKHHYLVEASRKVLCDEKNEAGPIEKRISFEALQSIIIEGYRRRVETEPVEEQKKRNLKREHQCAQAGRVIGQLEQETQKIKESDERGVLSSLVESVKNWVGGICSAN